MTDDPREFAVRRRALARRAMEEANAVSVRLLEVQRQAIKLLGGDADSVASGEIDARMRLLEKRMLYAEQMMREAEDAVISANDAVRDPSLVRSRSSVPAGKRE